MGQQTPSETLEGRVRSDSQRSSYQRFRNNFKSFKLAFNLSKLQILTDFFSLSQINDYKEAEQSARKNRNGIWQYGDSTEDQAGEFGLGGPR